LDQWFYVYLAVAGEEYEFTEADLNVFVGILEDYTDSVDQLEAWLKDFWNDADPDYDEAYVRPGLSVAGFGKWLDLRYQQQKAIKRVLDESSPLSDHTPPSAEEAYEKWKRDFIACGIPMCQAKDESFLRYVVECLKKSAASMAEIAQDGFI